jgi:hypothetical protein
MPRKTRAAREAELDARSLAGTRARLEALDRWDRISAEHSVRLGHNFRFENVSFDLEREEKTTDFRLAVRVYLNPRSAGYFEVFEMERLNAFPSPDTIRAEIESASDLIRPEKIVAAYGRLLRCFVPVPMEEMHREVGYDS